jgi:hypothetical protein
VADLIKRSLEVAVLNAGRAGRHLLHLMSTLLDRLYQRV